MVCTAACENGTLTGTGCSGKLVTAERFRFRALKAHYEVCFWSVGLAPDTTEKFTQCAISDGLNWVCQASADDPKTIALAMHHGRWVQDVTGTVKNHAVKPPLR